MNRRTFFKWVGGAECDDLVVSRQAIERAVPTIGPLTIDEIRRLQCVRVDDVCVDGEMCLSFECRLQAPLPIEYGTAYIGA